MSSSLLGDAWCQSGGAPLGDGNLETRRRRAASGLAVLLFAHAGLLAWVGWRSTPVSNEASHVAAGVAVWHLGRFDLYGVRPDLAVMVLIFLANEVSPVGCIYYGFFI